MSEEYQKITIAEYVEYQSLKQKLDCAVKALGWYKDGYGVTTDDSYVVHVDENISYRRSGGKRARLALEEIRK